MKRSVTLLLALVLFACAFVALELNAFAEDYACCTDCDNEDVVLTCKGYYCNECGEYFGEPGEHNLGTQTCLGYQCSYCKEYFGEASSEHRLKSQITCKGYMCYDCNEYFGEGGDDYHSYKEGVCEFCGLTCAHIAGEQNCKGYLCVVCDTFFGEADPEKHSWTYGRCDYHSDITIPDDYECEHEYYKGRCQICGCYCEHTNIDNGGKCYICEYQYPWIVTTNNVTRFCDSLYSALEVAVDGSYIKLLCDITQENTYTIDKAITLDLNGYSTDTASTVIFYVQANARFLDSVGGGFLNAKLVIESECTLESGEYFSITMNLDVLGDDATLADIVVPCAKAYEINSGEEIDCSQETNANYVSIVATHEEGTVTCAGYLCNGCGISIGAGDVNAHSWQDATCTTPATCLFCFSTIGTEIGHKWTDATCDSPKTCTVCSDTEGEALGHDWTDATCDSPKTCTVCSEIEGEALGHDWIDATTEAPKTCDRCGETEGEPLEKPDDVLTDDGDDADTNSEEPVRTNWFVALVEMIIAFFKRIFGLA